MPRTKGSKNKTKISNDYASQIAEKQDIITSLTTEIAAITANIDTLKADLKEKKVALKKAEKEVVKLEAKKSAAEQKAAEEAKKAEAESVVKKLLASCTSRLARRKMFPSNCMPIRKQSCVHSRVASGFVLLAN